MPRALNSVQLCQEAEEVHDQCYRRVHFKAPFSPHGDSSQPCARQPRIRLSFAEASESLESLHLKPLRSIQPLKPSRTPDVDRKSRSASKRPGRRHTQTLLSAAGHGPAAPPDGQARAAASRVLDTKFYYVTRFWV